jgi:hypothetical protein
MCSSKESWEGYKGFLVQVTQAGSKWMFWEGRLRLGATRTKGPNAVKGEMRQGLTSRDRVSEDLGEAT